MSEQASGRVTMNTDTIRKIRFPLKCHNHLPIASSSSLSSHTCGTASILNEFVSSSSPPTSLNMIWNNMRRFEVAHKCFSMPAQFRLVMMSPTSGCVCHWHQYHYQHFLVVALTHHNYFCLILY